MYPIILSFKVIGKTLTIGGYGLMLGIAFYSAFAFTEREFKLRGIDPDLAYRLLLAIIPTAIIGAKIFHIMENMEEFLADPLGMIFSGAGLTVYGGLILSIIVSYFIIRRSVKPVLTVYDMASPAIALGYAIGRMGCHVAGDGCYGIQTAGFLGVAYPNGIVPTTMNVFPTPVFESFISFLTFLFLLQYRKYEHKPGHIFFLYIILNGLARFFIEFIRLNEKIMLNLTQAQLISLGLMLTGMAGLYFISRTSRETQS